jgi:adenylate kinase family enzyme
MRVQYVMGPTNAGKSTLIDALVPPEPLAPGMKYFPSSRYPGVGAIRVGKLLRAKYGEAYFQGQGALQTTEAEATSMVEEGVRAAHADGKRLVLVDGQPRTKFQLDWVLAFRDGRSVPHTAHFLFLHASRDVRRARVQARDGANADALALSLARLDGDAPIMLDLMCELRLMPEPMHLMRTGDGVVTEFVRNMRVMGVIE